MCLFYAAPQVLLCLSLYRSVSGCIFQTVGINVVSGVQHCPEFGYPQRRGSPLPLKQTQIATLPAGFHHDGYGLYLSVSNSSARSWMYRFTSPVTHKVRYMGLGSASAIPLSRARELLKEPRRLRAEGIDPIDARDAARAVPPKPVVTFQQVADDYLKAHTSEWKHEKHRDKWESYLRRHIFPTLGSMPVDAIATEHVLATLKPIWTKIPSAAGQCRSMIEMVLNAAKAHGLRNGDNPATWRGNLQHLLPKRGKVKNHAAMGYAQVPAFVAELRKRHSMASYALEFLILTATRASETLGAQWSEIDMATATWVIPDTRMKGGRKHEIPLSSSAMALLEWMTELRQGPLVFPGPKGTLNGTAMPKLMHGRMATSGTVHGFRSSFRTWAAERTDFAHEICEDALAHVQPSAVVRAYRRTSMLGRRRELMQQWSDYLSSK